LSARTHPCVFRSAFLREQVDPKVKAEWAARFGQPAPFGNLRRMWRSEHCETLNPYESESCAYPEQDCAMAFLVATRRTENAARSAGTATGYFRAVCRTMALERADDKPLERERRHAQGPGHTGASRPSDAAGLVRGVPLAGGDWTPGAGDPSVADTADMRRAHARPVSVAQLLGSLDLGPRQERSEDGSEGRIG